MAESITGTVVTPAIGGAGYQHLYQITVEYTSTVPFTLSFVAGDSGNGSYPPQPISIPSSGGSPTKFTTKVSANKWKWLQAIHTITNASTDVYLAGFVGDIKEWGSPRAYKPTEMFGNSGGYGGQV